MAAGDLYFRVNGTELGPTGADVVVQVELEPSGPFARGTAKLKIQKRAGGYSFLKGHHVQIYVNIGAAYRALFGGFVCDVDIDQVQLQDGAHLVYYMLDCVDYNELLDELVCEADPAQAVTDGGVTTFQGHVERICRWLTKKDYSVSPTFDTGGVGLSGTYTLGSGFRLLNDAGKSLRELLQQECNHYKQDIDPTSYPWFWLSPPSSGVSSTGWTNGQVLLNLVDGNVNPTPAYHFHDGSSGASQPPTRILVEKFRRRLTGSALRTRVEATGEVAGVAYVKSSRADNTATYPNPYDFRVISATTQQTWNEKVLDGGTLGSQAEIQALADRFIAARKNPRETIEITANNDTIDPGNLFPGGTVRVTWAIHGISGVDYRVPGIRLTLRYKRAQNIWSLVWELQCANKIRELGDGAENTVTEAPVIRDLVRPNPPTGGSLTLNRYGGNGLTDVRVAYTASTSPDVAYYEWQIIQVNGGVISGIAYGLSTDIVHLYPGISAEARIYAVDSSANRSLTYLSYTFTPADKPPTDGIENGDFVRPSLADSTKPDVWAETATNNGTGILVSAPLSPKVAQALQMTLPGGIPLATDVWLSNKVKAVSADSATGTQFQVSARVIFNTSAAVGTIKVAIDHYNISDVVIKSDYLFNATPAASTLYTKTKTVLCPVSTMYVRLRLDGLADSGATAQVVTFAACQLGPANVTSASAAGLLATTDTTGQLAVPTVAGTPTGVPDLDTGSVGLEVDTTSGAERIAVYVNGAWTYAALGPTAGGILPITDNSGNLLFTDDDNLIYVTV